MRRVLGFVFGGMRRFSSFGYEVSGTTKLRKGRLSSARSPSSIRHDSSACDPVNWEGGQMLRQSTVIWQPRPAARPGLVLG